MKELKRLSLALIRNFIPIALVGILSLTILNYIEIHKGEYIPMYPGRTTEDKMYDRVKDIEDKVDKLDEIYWMLFDVSGDHVDIMLELNELKLTIMLWSN